MWGRPAQRQPSLRPAGLAAGAQCLRRCSQTRASPPIRTCLPCPSSLRARRAAGATVLSFTDTSVTVRLAPPDTTTVFDSLSVKVCKVGVEPCEAAPVACDPAPTAANTPCDVTVESLDAASEYTATASAREGTADSVVGTPARFTTRYT